MYLHSAPTLLLLVLFSAPVLSFPTSTASLDFTAPLNTVIVQGYEFGLLDNTSPWSTEIGGQEGALLAPTVNSGWALANASNPIHRMAVAAYPWGTACLAMNGRSLTTLSLFDCSDDTAVDSTEDGWSVVGDVPQRILLYRVDPSNLAAPLACLNFTGINCNDSWVPDSQNHRYDEMLWISTPAGETSVFSQSVAITEQKYIDAYAQGVMLSVECAVTDSSEDAFKQLYAELELTFVTGGTHTLKAPFSGSSSVFIRSTSQSYLPSHDVESIRVSFVVKSGSVDTDAYFRNLEILPFENLVSKPDFSTDEFGKTDGWEDFGVGYMPDTADWTNAPTATTFNSVLMVNAKVDQINGTAQGAFHTIDGEGWDSDNTMLRTLYIGGWAKTLYVSDLMDDNFGIVVDIRHADGTGQYGHTLQFPVGSHDWVYRDLIIQLNKPATGVNLTLTFREHTGIAWFDHVLVTAINRMQTNHSMAVAGVFGDPHFCSFGQELFSQQTPGEFIAFQNEDLEIQTRHSQLGGTGASLVSAVAFSVMGQTVSIQFNEVTAEGWTLPSSASNPTVYYNGFPIVSNYLSLPGQGILVLVPKVSIDSVKSENSDTYSTSETLQTFHYVLVTRDARVKVGVQFLTDMGKQGDYTKNVGYFSVVALINSARYANSAGYLGNVTSHRLHSHGDGDTPGVPVSLTTATSEILYSFIHSWKIPSEDDSLFQYTNGVTFDGMSQASNDHLYTDSPTIDSFPEPAQFSAYSICYGQHLGHLEEMCVIDVLLAGVNISSAQSYHEVERDMGMSNVTLVEKGNQIHDYYAEIVDESNSYTLAIVATLAIVLAVGGMVTIFRCRKRKVNKVVGADEEVEIELQQLNDMTEDERLDRFEL